MLCVNRGECVVWHLADMDMVAGVEKAIGDNIQMFDEDGSQCYV